MPGEVVHGQERELRGERHECQTPPLARIHRLVLDAFLYQAWEAQRSRVQRQRVVDDGEQPVSAPTLAVRYQPLLDVGLRARDRVVVEMPRPPDPGVDGV